MKPTELKVAKVKNKRTYIISYLNPENMRQELAIDDYESFFAIVELLQAAKRKFTYKILNNSYLTIN